MTHAGPYLIRHKLQPFILRRHAQQVVALATHDMEAVGHLLWQIQLPEGAQEAGQPALKLRTHSPRINEAPHNSWPASSH